MYSVLAILGVLFLACIAALVAWGIINQRGFSIPNLPHTRNRELPHLQKPGNDEEGRIEGQGTGL